MNDRQKALGIGAAILVIAALFFLFNRGGNANTVVRSNSGSLPQSQGVTLQQVTFNREPFTLPPLTVGERWQGLSAIGACCADCSGSTPRQSAAPRASNSSGITFVYNEGARGANVFNYIQPAPVVAKPLRGYIIGRAG